MDKKTFEYKDEAQQKHFEYLDNLFHRWLSIEDLDNPRASGITNMFPLPGWLQEEFEINKDESYKVFQAWVDTFEDRGCPGSDK